MGLSSHRLSGRNRMNDAADIEKKTLTLHSIATWTSTRSYLGQIPSDYSTHPINPTHPNAFRCIVIYRFTPLLKQVCSRHAVVSVQHLQFLEDFRVFFARYQSKIGSYDSSRR